MENINFDFKNNPTEDLNKLLVGKSVVSADKDSGVAILSDGTKLFVEANEGGCSCGSGDFFLERLSSVSNAIMSVKASDRFDREGESGKKEVFEVFVYTEGVDSGETFIEVAGDIGSGYYGSGFTITVTLPDEEN